MTPEVDPAGMAAARRYAQWHIGDRYWADNILNAYFYPVEANRQLDEEMS